MALFSRIARLRRARDHRRAPAIEHKAAQAQQLVTVEDWLRMLAVEWTMRMRAAVPLVPRPLLKPVNHGRDSRGPSPAHSSLTPSLFTLASRRQ